MLKYAVIIISLLIMPSLLTAASSAIFITDLSEYPIIHANIYFLDDDGKPIYDIQESDITINENGIPSDIIDFTCQSGSVGKAVSSILTVDVSGSMTREKTDNARNAITQWIDLLPDQELAAITSFNKHNYLLRDFTSDKSLLKKSLNFIDGNGGTDFDNAFFGVPAGIFNLTPNSKDRPVIILYTDGEGNADYQKIVTEAQKVNARIYAFVTGDEIPFFLSEISEKTGGKVFGTTLANSDVENAYKYIFQDSHDYKPCSISWVSTSCNAEKNIEIRVDSKGIVQNLLFSVDKSYLPHFAYPNSNTVDFGTVPIGNIANRKVRLEAVYDDFTIDTIISSNPSFGIDLEGLSYPLSIKQGIPVDLSIEYQSDNENYTLSTFEIVSDACQGNTFFAIAGGKTNPAADSLLKVIFPNGDEKLVAGSDTTIIWEGISSKDTVSIEYTTNGTDWKLVSQYADGLSYRWQVPYDISSTCRIRLKHTNTSLESGDNYIIDGHNRQVNKIVWGRNDFDTLFSASRDGTLKKWYYKYKKEFLILTGQINVSDITQNTGNLIASISSDERVKVYNTITSELLADYGQSSGIRSVDWSKDSRFISGGSNDGTILIWKLSDKVNAIASSKLHSASVIDIQWNPSSNLIASADEDGNIIVSDMKLQSGSYIISQIAVFPKYQYKINSLEWISDTKFAVAAQNEEVKIWDINQLSLPVSYLRNDISENIIDLDYNSTQKIIATAGTLNGVRIFDLSQLRSSYQPIFQYSGHSSQLSSVSVRFDGTTVASADNEGKIHIWKIGESTEEYKALQDDVSDKDFSIVAATVVAKDIDFGKTLLGFPSDSVLSKFVTNNYTFPISIDSISIEGSEKDRFELQKTFKNYRLLPKDSLILVIKSLNNQAGDIEADIVIYYNSLKSTAKIRANVIQSQIDIDNRYFFIGKANLDTLVSRRITCLKNLSGQKISIKSLELQKINDDRFEFNNITGNVISPADSLVVEVRFTPEYVGNLSTALDIRTDYFDQTLTLLLSAEGTAPNLITADTVRFSNLICGNLQTDSIKIKNDGTGELIIKGISFSDDSYSSDLPLFFSIAAGDSAEIPIEFEAQSTGEFTTLMSIESNRTVRDITNSEITIIAVKDSLGFAFEKNVLEFSGLDENQSDTKELKITNTGTVPIEWKLPLKSENFEIISILPAITPPGTFSVATVEFKGGVKEKSPYGEIITLKDGCELEHNLSLIAVIGINDAEIEVAQDIVLPELFCKDSTSYSITLKNVGTTPLTISEAIAIADGDEFEFSKDYTGSIVLPNEILELELIYKSAEAGVFEGEVLLRTNAVNVSGGEVNINVSFSKEVLSLKASKDLLTLSGLMQDQIGIVTLKLTNNGTKDVTNLSFSAMNRFEILNMPTELGVGASKDVLVRFNGGKLGITYNEELYVIDDCGNALRIKLSATVDKMPNAKLEIGSVSAYPGQTVKVPVSLELLDQIELSGTELVSFTLSFNKSLLLPTGDYVFSIDTTLKKIVIENIALQNLLSGIDIEFGAYLGDTNFTRIYVSDIEVKGGDNILVSSVNGAFTLLGVCTEGGNRFVIDTGKLQLFQNYPNPVLENTTISFFAIEQGMHEVSIYNVYGDKLEILFLQFVSPGYYEVVFDADRYPSGSYIYVLQTPSTTIKRKLQILR